MNGRARAMAKAGARTVRGVLRGVVLLAAFFLTAQDAGAQALIVAGDTVRVELFGGGEVRGMLESVLPGAIVVNDPATVEADTVRLNDVRALSVRRDASYGGNAFKGGVMGASLAAVTGITAAIVGCRNSSGNDYCGWGAIMITAVAIPVMGFFGAAIGAETGEDRKWIRADVSWLQPQ